MSNMKNFIQAKKQKTTDIGDKPQHFDDNASKKKREEQAKPVKNDENDWDNNEYPEYNVNVKSYSELKAKKQQEPARGIYLSKYKLKFDRNPIKIPLNSF